MIHLFIYLTHNLVEKLNADNTRSDKPVVFSSVVWLLHDTVKQMLNQQQCCRMYNTHVYDRTAYQLKLWVHLRLYQRGKEGDLAPLYQSKIRRPMDNTKTPPKLRLHNGCGPISWLQFLSAIFAIELTSWYRLTSSLCREDLRNAIMM